MIHAQSLRRYRKIALPSMLVLLSLGCLSIVLFLQAKQRTEEDLHMMMKTNVALATMQFDAERIASIEGKEDMRTEAFRDTVERLRQIRRQTPHARFVYILRKTENPFLLAFVADADSLATEEELDRNGNGTIEPEEEGSYPGDTYDVLQAPAMRYAFDGPVTDPEITHDQWGSFFSGYAPIRDRSGTTVAVLGIDMYEEDVLRLSWAFFPPLLLLLFLIVSILVALYTAHLAWEHTENKRVLLTLLGNLPGMACRSRYDEERTMEFLSDGCRDLTGYENGDLLGNRIVAYGRLIHPDDRRPVNYELKSALRARKSFQLSYRIITKQDEEKWVWEQGQGVYGSRGEMQAVESFIMDVTEHKHLDLAKTVFLHAVSHQLRTPATAVRWTLSTLRESCHGKMHEIQKGLLEDAERATEQMIRTLDTMLEVSNVESGKIELKLHRVPLRSLLEEVHQTFKREIASKGHAFSIDCPQTISLRTDPDLLREIFASLFKNAIVYTPPGGSIRVVVQGQDDAHIRVDIHDNGCGIPQHEQYRVFTRFFRGSNAAIHLPDGSGLGLYLTQALTRLLGGSISFVSEKNAGSVFTVVLHDGIPDDPPWEIHPSPPDPQQAPAADKA